jgi:hypothetical protein
MLRLDQPIAVFLGPTDRFLPSDAPSTGETPPLPGGQPTQP